MLEEKHEDVMKEIEKLKVIASRIENAKKGCRDIEKYLNRYTIRPMAPIKILAEISDFRAYSEFDVIHENRNELSDTSILKSLKRYLTFTEEGIETNKMLITKDIEYDIDKEANDELKYNKCVYTIIEDELNKKGTMEETFLRSREWIDRNGYRLKGVAVISMLLVAYKEGKEKSYLEVYIPIE